MIINNWENIIKKWTKYIGKQVNNVMQMRFVIFMIFDKKDDTSMIFDGTG